MKNINMLISIIVVAACILSACQPQPTPTEAPSLETIAPTEIPPEPTLAPTVEEKPEEAADMVLKNGFIYTVDKERSVAQSIAIKGDTIIYVGDDAGAETYIGDKTVVIDLDGKMVLPGFIDSHSHAMSGASEVYSVGLFGMKSIDEYKEGIADFLKEHPEVTFLQGGGWINPLFPPEGPSKELLDEWVPDIPAVLQSEDYHSVWANSKAIEMAGITKDTEDPEGGIIERDAEGNPDGTFRETAAGLLYGIIPPFTTEQITTGLEYFQDMAHSYGMTGVHIPGMGEEDIDLLHGMEESGALSMYFVAAQSIDALPDKATMDDLIARREAEKGGLFELKTIKIFMDGVVEGSTAYLEEPYVHKPDYRGEVYWEPESFNEACAALEKEGFQIHVHSIGDAATRITLDGFEYARKVNGSNDTRHGITHIQLVSPEDVIRFGELGVVAIPQPYWFVIDPYYTQAVEYLGQERADMQYPMKSFLDSGVVVASASDYPVTTPPRVMDAIETGVTRAFPGETDPAMVLTPDERVTVEDMIASFTINGAYAYFLDDITGSLEVGKKADLIVLDNNILEMPVSEIHTTEVLLTIFNGQEVFRSESYQE